MVFRRSETPLEADRYFEGLEILYRRTTVSPEEVDRIISKAQNSNSKWTEVQMKPRLYSKIDEGHFEGLRLPRMLRNFEDLRLLDEFLDKISKFCGFEGPESLLRQTSYLRAHGFPDANKRWERIKVKGSKRKVEKRQREEPLKLDFEIRSKKLKLFVGSEPTETMSKPLTTT
ncbi:hypothetical protein RclHR1_09810004 [Rhizophagus clarus]|uniref:Uncharacterized protein n=1 Tax=Rhizophagus clarus TaxID=94130 RepID=A0A2Z6SIE4_9GLOM|nr:hypothetical protein RclHR1_09810004 [Rhizophagus clarus]